MTSLGSKAERLFADLCSRQFLRGFVFHSPRFEAPTEKEAGDVVLWVRRQVTVIEILAREATNGASTRQFVKRIGEKRKQLRRDYNAFRNSDFDLKLTNEQGVEIPFDTKDLEEIGFFGIILLDCDDHIEKPHYESIARTLAMPFPVSVMTRSDFLDLTSEIDTIPDLNYYLSDRAKFLRQVYSEQASLFLDFNNRLEKNLVSFYKLHENHFPVSAWKESDALHYHTLYQSILEKRITARNLENADSYIVDQIIDLLREVEQPGHSTLLHSWELATLTRRQRAIVLSPKIINAIDRMMSGNPSRHFAYFNQATGCWLVFYFQFGGDQVAFRNRVKELTRLKLFVEMRENNFKYSVIGYGFRKSAIETGATFDGITLRIEDADAYDAVSTAEYREALKYFGKRDLTPIKEFPS